MSRGWKSPADCPENLQACAPAPDRARIDRGLGRPRPGWIWPRLCSPGGVLRADRSRLAFEHELTLGHFGLPHLGGIPARVERWDAGDRRIITAAIPGRRVALIAYRGWGELASPGPRGLQRRG